MKFQIKLMLSMTVMMSLLFAVGASVLIYRTWKTSVDEALSAAVRENVMSVRMLSLTTINQQETDKTVAAAVTESGSNAAAVMKDSGIIYISDKYEDVDFMSCISESDKTVAGYRKSGDAVYIIVSTPVTGYGSGDRYYICTAADATYIWDETDSLMRAYAGIFALMAAAIGLMSWVLSTVLVRPISRLMRGVGEVSAGNFGYRTGIRTDDEMGALSEQFDEMAAQIEEYTERLKEAAESKERFTGALTHEIKTPMTSIIGYSELLLSGQLTDEESDDALRFIHSESKRMERLSKKLLMLFTVGNDGAEMKSADPGAVTESVAEHLRITLEDKRISLSCSTQHGSCMMDEDLIRTMLINLIDNSRKASAKHIYVTQTLTEERVCYSVRDDGRGIPEDSLKHITEAFYRVDKSRSRKQGGAGLGLALVGKIVELHNGTIDIESTVGQGTEITVVMKR